MEAAAKQQIQAHAKVLGFDDCRVTDASRPASTEHYQAWIKKGHHGRMGYLERNQAKRSDLRLVLDNIQSVISLSTSYFQNKVPEDIPSTAPPTGVIARYARYQDYHDVLADKLKQLTTTVTASVDYESQSLWYVDTGPILERDLAQRAGIGFIGKHTNLISRKLGNWFFISEILTSIPLPADTPEKNRCGHCQACLTACPTDAITQPFQLDARRCISYLTIELKDSIPTELRPLIGDRIFGCDDCLAACPWNRFAKEGQIMKSHADLTLKGMDLEQWAQLDEAQFRQRFKGTPFYRTKWRGMMRNVCVAMGNTGTKNNLPTLEKLARSSEPLVAEHATWAIAEIEARSSSADSI